MKTLYLECASGISGDMTIGALLDLGADRDALEQGIASLPFDGYTLKFGRAKKAGIDAFDFDVLLDGPTHAHSHTHGEQAVHEHNHHGHEHENHSHGAHGGQEHTHGEQNTQEHNHYGHVHEDANDHGEQGMHGDIHHGHADSHEGLKACRHGEPHVHSHGAGHSHNHGEQEHHHADGHAHSRHSHVHRNLHDIEKIIDAGALAEPVRKLAKRIFMIVAEAEAKAHGMPVDAVHFHEVGAVDSIIDIVGAAICIDSLGVDRVISSPLGEGSGTVQCAHGKMPVPVPAVVNIASAQNVPLRMTGRQGELVTPTGIAIVSAAAESFQVPEQMNILKTGYGAGNREDPQYANVLRAFLLEEPEAPEAAEGDTVTLLETNIDDQSPETLAYACGLLLGSGALDVWTEPIYMKKNRPAVKLCVLCAPDAVQRMTEMLFRHTTSIGVRKSNLSRTIMHREPRRVKTRYGMADVKHCEYQDIIRNYVEFESAKTLAEENHVTIEQVIRETLSEICD